VENLLPPITPVEDVVNGPGKLNANFPRHARNSGASLDKVQNARTDSFGAS
jgi:hypothetical protein